jgi:hypothetical protein
MTKKAKKKEYEPLYQPTKDRKEKAKIAEAAGIRKAEYDPEKACCLVSKMDQPMEIEYEGKTITLSPRAGAKHPVVIADKSLLGKLPKGVFQVQLPKHLRKEKK